MIPGASTDREMGKTESQKHKGHFPKTHTFKAVRENVLVDFSKRRILKSQEICHTKTNGFNPPGTAVRASKRCSRCTHHCGHGTEQSLGREKKQRNSVSTPA